MLDHRRLWIVARFELIEAVRSRLFLVVVGLYGAGAAIGSLVFVKIMAAAEDAARRALAASSQIPEAQVPPDLIREHALPLAAGLVRDPAIRGELLRMTPLSIFYGYMALSLVPLLVLATSAGSIAADVSSGASRFVLFRCDRLTWTAGKLVGQELLLGAGLLIGATLAGLVGLQQDPGFAAESWLWLLRASFRAWLYGSAYLGIFLGLSIVTRSALGARALALFALIASGIAHTVLASDFANAKLPGLRYLALVFPGDHQRALWSPEWASYLPAAVALLLIGTAGFGVGHYLFLRRDV